MSNYYLHDGHQQLGPFTLDELKTKNITKETPVWREGMPEWKKAGELSELVDFFYTIPPPLKAAPPPFVTAVLPTKTSKKKVDPIIILLIILIVSVGAFFIWKSNSVSGENKNEEIFNSSDLENRTETQREKTPAELKEELSQKERENPQIYIDATGTYRENLIGETVLEGKIKNNATAAVFKDIVIKTEFIAASGTVLGSEKFTRYETLGPGFEVTFKFKAFAPKEMKSVRISIIDAVPVN